MCQVNVYCSVSFLDWSFWDLTKRYVIYSYRNLVMIQSTRQSRDHTSLWDFRISGSSRRGTQRWRTPSYYVSDWYTRWVPRWWPGMAARLCRTIDNSELSIKPYRNRQIVQLKESTKITWYPKRSETYIYNTYWYAVVWRLHSNTKS